MPRMKRKKKSKSFYLKETRGELGAETALNFPYNTET